MIIKLITGGPGPEREGSLASGRDVFLALRSLGHEVSVVDLSSPSLFAELGECDVAFLTTHGWFGEDGKLQGALDILGIPYLGSGTLASAISMYKPACLRMAQTLGVRCPKWKLVDAETITPKVATSIFEELGPDLFAKPTSGGGSIGAGIARSSSELLSDLQQGTPSQPRLVSEYVRGTDVTIGLLEFEGEIQVLPPLATRYEAPFYDYEVKHAQHLRSHDCPARMPCETVRGLLEAARRLFCALPCQGFARFDFIVDDAGREWFLEANTLPGLSQSGNFATMGAAAGLSYRELIGQMLKTFRSEHTYRP